MFSAGLTTHKSILAGGFAPDSTELAYTTPPHLIVCGQSGLAAPHPQKTSPAPRPFWPRASALWASLLRASSLLTTFRRPVPVQVTRRVNNQTVMVLVLSVWTRICSCEIAASSFRNSRKTIAQYTAFFVRTSSVGAKVLLASSDMRLDCDWLMKRTPRWLSRTVSRDEGRRNKSDKSFFFSPATAT